MSFQNFKTDPRFVKIPFRALPVPRPAKRRLSVNPDDLKANYAEINRRLDLWCGSIGCLITTQGKIISDLITYAESWKVKGIPFHLSSPEHRKKGAHFENRIKHHTEHWLRLSQYLNALLDFNVLLLIMPGMASDAPERTELNHRLTDATYVWVQNWIFPMKHISRLHTEMFVDKDTEWMDELRIAATYSDEPTHDNTMFRFMLVSLIRRRAYDHRVWLRLEKSFPPRVEAMDASGYFLQVMTPRLKILLLHPGPWVIILPWI